MKENPVRVALIGMGKVGINILLNVENSIKMHLIADSKNIFWKKDNQPFNQNELRFLINWKKGRDPSERKLEQGQYFKSRGVNSLSFDSPQEEIKILDGILSGAKHRWIIIDSTSMPSDQDSYLIKAMMECLAYCTVNKSPWTDFNNCKNLLNTASADGSFLGLNCISGVWSDQMETIPIALSGMRDIRQLVIEKRDNSSLNSFFSMLNKGMTPSAAIAKVEARGHLEPGAVNGFVEEIQDLVNKTKIIANISGAILEIVPKRVMMEESSLPDFSSPEVIAKWYLEGKKLGFYRAPRSHIRIDIESKKIATKIEASEMMKTHLLAREFPWKCAFAVRSERQSIHEGFLGVGYGGAENTAKKIIWEVIRSKRLRMSRTSKQKGLGHALPILEELAMNEASAMRLKSKLYHKLGSFVS